MVKLYLVSYIDDFEYEQVELVESESEEEARATLERADVVPVGVRLAA